MIAISEAMLLIQGSEMINNGFENFDSICSRTFNMCFNFSFVCFFINLKLSLINVMSYKLNVNLFFFMLHPNFYL